MVTCIPSGAERITYSKDRSLRITNIVPAFLRANKITPENRRQHSLTPPRALGGGFECNGDLSSTIFLQRRQLLPLSLTCLLIRPTIPPLHDRSDHLALPYRREARRRGNGRGL